MAAQSGPHPGAAMSAQEQIALAQAAYGSPAIPRLYTNGFLVGQTAADINMVLMANGVPVGTLNMSYESAKSLASDLASAVGGYERAIGRAVNTIAQNTEKLNAAMGQP